MSERPPLLVLFDGHALIHRAWHALPPLTLSKTGEPVSAVFGFASMLLKTFADLRPTHAAVAFDAPGPTFRHEQFQDYKANRPEAPEDLRVQFDRVKELVQVFGLPIYELQGYEADDVLGTLSRQAEAQGIDTIIVTGDTDTLQLVTPRVRVYASRGMFSDMVLYDEAKVRERYAIDPAQLVDYKGLKGDSTDNIPGVPGVGDKTAAKLIQQFGSIKGIFAHLTEVTPAKLQETLRQNEEVARRSMELATIVLNVPVSLDLGACQIKHYDRNRVVELFRELEFRSLLERLPEQPSAAGPGSQLELFQAEPFNRRAEPSPQAVVKATTLEVDYHTVDTEEALAGLAAKLAAAPFFAVDVETTGKDPMRAELVGIALALKPAEGFYIPIGHHQGQQLSLERVRQVLGPLLADPKLGKVAHNANYDLTVLAEHDMPVVNTICDTMIAAFLLNEKGIGLKDLAFTKLGIEMTPISALIGNGPKQRSMAEVDIPTVTAYASADVDMTLRLKELFEPQLQAGGLWKLFTEVEVPLIDVLCQMERNGVALDTPFLREMSQQMSKRLQELELDIYNDVGHRFNINSTQQLGDVLFKELRLPSARRTKLGYSTDAAVLEELRGVHPIIEKVLEYRQIIKLKSTYVDALPSLVHPRTGRVHTNYSQTVAATGRLSSSEPNLQNIPVRTPEGRQVRRAFVAQGDPKDTWSFIGADYSQIELRILAHMTEDPELVQAFLADEDIHTATAATVFRVPKEEVSAEHRRVAKMVNFGVIYGLSDFGLAQGTNMSREEASSFINDYFARYKKVKEYVDATKVQVRTEGYVQTLLGRRRYIAEIRSPNRQVQAAAERMAINMPVQGTAADIIKVAMIQLHRRMRQLGLRSRMLLQVHDELIFESPEEEMETIRGLILEIMPNAIPLRVPLKVEIKTGKNWGELE